MGKCFRSLALVGIVAGLMTVTGLSVAPAQVKEKDKEKKDDKKVEAKGDDIGVTEVYKAKDGWRFRIKGPEGKSIAIGTVPFEKKEDAAKAVETLKTILTKGKVVEIKEEKK
ncbi:MAG: hypothetical protein C0467_09285 [Planctomycetaceae bacterium]|nr:hypothetical protein [Planctomycetaceae bacterium]